MSRNEKKYNSFQDARKTSEYRNRANEANKEAQEKLIKIKEIFNDIKLIKDNLLETKKEIEDNNSEATDIKNQFDIKTTKLTTLISNLDKILEKHPDLDSDIENFEDKIEKLDEFNTKITTLHSSSLTKKKEIDALYFEINGYTTTNEETGEEEKVDGLKNKLENIYNDLESNYKLIKENLDVYKEEKIEELNKIKNDSEKSYLEINTKWEGKFKILEKKIEDLLPNALTAGLSSAYSNKRENEEKELEKLTKTFHNGIVGLISVSLIPFIVSIVFLFKDISLEDTILKLPRLVLSILPLYVPIGWFTYSANKKANLSKRLIEEYTHKEVLSNTFEGLSTQIKGLDDSELSKELKIKLLTNILDVSSENPGKLISDYNSSDHPIIDALNKSEKLSKSINKLENIPGLGKIADFLKNTSKKVIEKKENEIVEVIDDVTKNIIK